MDTIVKVMRALEIAGEELRKERATRSQFGCSNLEACINRCEKTNAYNVWREWIEKDLVSQNIEGTKNTKVEIFTEGDESKEVNLAITMLIANQFKETRGWNGNVKFDFFVRDEREEQEEHPKTEMGVASDDALDSVRYLLEGLKTNLINKEELKDGILALSKEIDEKQEELDILKTDLMALELEYHYPAKNTNTPVEDSKDLGARIISVANTLKGINEELKQRIDSNKDAEKFVEEFKKQNGGTQLRDMIIEGMIEEKGIDTFIKESDCIKDWIKIY